MASRIYEGKIQRWWDNHLDQFIAQQADLTKKKEAVIKELVLFSDSASDTYEIFWGRFPTDLYNWLRRLRATVPQEGLRKINHRWAHEDLVALHRVDAELTRAVDFWVKTTLEGYVVEFAAECYQSFSKAEAVFHSGLRGKLLKEIPLWIKALMVDEGLIEFHKTSMEA